MRYTCGVGVRLSGVDGRRQSDGERRPRCKRARVPLSRRTPRIPMYCGYGFVRDACCNSSSLYLLYSDFVTDACCKPSSRYALYSGFLTDVCCKPSPLYLLYSDFVTDACCKPSPPCVLCFGFVTDVCCKPSPPCVLCFGSVTYAWCRSSSLGVFYSTYSCTPNTIPIPLRPTPLLSILVRRGGEPPTCVDHD